MGMAADHLLADGSRHVFDVESADFLGHAGMKHDLQQEVAQFLPQGNKVGLLDGIGHLIGFFDGVGRDGGEGLLDVPGAAPLRIAQAGHDRDEALKGPAGIGKDIGLGRSLGMLHGGARTRSGGEAEGRYRLT